jgi:hypothetical protein
MSTKTSMAKAALPEIQAAIDSDPHPDVKENAIDALDLALDPETSAVFEISMEPNGFRMSINPESSS